MPSMAPSRRSSLARFARSLPLVLLLGLVGCAFAPPERPDPALSAQIDALVDPDGAFAESPGMAVLVLRDGAVVHAKGYGVADLETGAPITRSTPFRLASVSKAFTCFAILQLAQDGALSIEDPALKYLPELERFGPEVTIRHLMQHTSGLPEYYAYLGMRNFEIPSVDDDPVLTADDAAAIYKEWGNLIFLPGERYAY